MNNYGKFEQQTLITASTPCSCVITLPLGALLVKRVSSHIIFSLSHPNSNSCLRY